MMRTNTESLPKKRTTAPSRSERKVPNADIRTRDDLEQALLEADKSESTPMTAENWGDIRKELSEFIDDRK